MAISQGKKPIAVPDGGLFLQGMLGRPDLNRSVKVNFPRNSQLGLKFVARGGPPDRRCFQHVI
jgi:hypothetical protein